MEHLTKIPYQSLLGTISFDVAVISLQAIAHADPRRMPATELESYKMALALYNIYFSQFVADPCPTKKHESETCMAVIAGLRAELTLPTEPSSQSDK
jgi:hypothetical protein